MTPLFHIDQPAELLGGLSPSTFMRRHWHKKPLLVRQAWPGVNPPLTRSQLFALAGQDDVESRLIVRQADGDDTKWTLKRGPFSRRALPPLRQPGWTLLVQGLDLHVQAAHEMLSRFRFVPQARLDDLMISYASDGGGVGPHFDSYDVFLIQVQGRRRWRIGRLSQPQLRPEVPLKILSNFVAEQEWVLEAGDMLYLPPRWAHDGVADAECMTCSIGFRSATDHELARELLNRMMDADEAGDLGGRLYRDPTQAATDRPGTIPPQLQAFGLASVGAWLQRALKGQGGEIALGEALTEPKPGVWFEPGSGGVSLGVLLDRRTRMLYDDHHVYINGESWRASGPDARLLHALADRGALSAESVHRASTSARELLARWLAHGWLRSRG